MGGIWIISNDMYSFYEDLADVYHLIYEDWDRAIARQAAVLDPLLRHMLSRDCLWILDCACGIGTQEIGLASLGHQIVGSDLSTAAIARAKREAEARHLSIEFHVSDMTSLQEIHHERFDVVAALDNALPHLTAGQLILAARTTHHKLRPGGLIIASIRDYDRLIVERPTIQPPSFFASAGKRRIVHQVWDWTSVDAYTVHQYITVDSDGRWDCRHFSSKYRCLLRDELTIALTGAGFVEVEWLLPHQILFYQPIVIAKKALEIAGALAPLG